ncbi:hypothetical protein E4U59_002418 [Claviceps monticola]|nr:hypothetical protein E4U59_002418 [Claviceps monticola]
MERLDFLYSLQSRWWPFATHRNRRAFRSASAHKVKKVQVQQFCFSRKFGPTMSSHTLLPSMTSSSRHNM